MPVLRWARAGWCTARWTSPAVWRVLSCWLAGPATEILIRRSRRSPRSANARTARQLAPPFPVSPREKVCWGCFGLCQLGPTVTARTQCLSAPPVCLPVSCCLLLPGTSAWTATIWPSGRAGAAAGQGSDAHALEPLMLARLRCSPAPAELASRTLTTCQANRFDFKWDTLPQQASSLAVHPGQAATAPHPASASLWPTCSAACRSSSACPTWGTSDAGSPSSSPPLSGTAQLPPLCRRPCVCALRALRGCAFRAATQQDAPRS